MKRVRFRGTKKPGVNPEVSQDTQARLLFREEQRHDKEEAMAEYDAAGGYTEKDSAAQSGTGGA